MTKNKWGVEAVHDGEDFTRWEWGDDFGEAHEAFVREVSVAAAKVVMADLANDATASLDADAVFSINAFDGTFQLQVPLDVVIADFIESLGTIEGDDERQEAERLVAQLERAAASIRAALG